MPVRKETSARLVKEKVPYDLISREVVQSITDPTALAIYVYLLSLPEDWVVRRQQILDHFDGLGRGRYDAGMRHLKELGVVWVAVSRDEKGQIADRTIMVETVPKVGKPTIRENPQVGKPTMREIRPLKDTDSSKDTDIDKDSLFNEFWSHYPKKVDKVKARKKFNRLSKTKQEQAIADVKSRSWSKDPTYILNPTTYINNERWEDELAQPRPQSHGAML